MDSRFGGPDDRSLRTPRDPFGPPASGRGFVRETPNAQEPSK